MGEFLDGFRQGVRDTPRGYFAPLSALAGWLAVVAGRLFAITDRAIAQDQTTKRDRR